MGDFCRILRYLSKASLGTLQYNQERIKGLRELIPHIGPLPIIIPLKLFLERIGLPADNISSRVAWKFLGGIKVQKHVVRCRECESCDECETREDKEGLSSLNGK